MSTLRVHTVLAQDICPYANVLLFLSTTELGCKSHGTGKNGIDM